MSNFAISDLSHSTFWNQTFCLHHFGPCSVTSRCVTQARISWGYPWTP
jgi:hypothetical protein